MNRKGWTFFVGLVVVLEILGAVAGWVMTDMDGGSTGGGHLSSAFFGAAIGGWIGVAIGATTNGILERELDQIFAGTIAIIGSILGAIVAEYWAYSRGLGIWHTEIIFFGGLAGVLLAGIILSLILHPVDTLERIQSGIESLIDMLLKLLGTAICVWGRPRSRW